MSPAAGLAAAVEDDVEAAQPLPAAVEDDDAAQQCQDVDLPAADIEAAAPAQPPPPQPPPGLPWWLRSIVSVAKELFTGVPDAPALPAPAGEEEEEALCPICYSEPPTFTLTQACGHQLCISCSVRYLRDAVGDRTQISPQGVPCAMRGGGCGAFVTSTDAMQLLSKRDAEMMRSAAVEGSSPLSFRSLAAAERETHAGRGLMLRYVPAQVTGALRSWVPTWYTWTEQR
eukprot:68393-Prymnesium_polylepis.1